MHLSETLSRRIVWCSFWGALAVIFIHSQTWSGMPEGAAFFRILQQAVHSRLTSFAVPMFFVISGYFFQAGCEDGFTYGKILLKKAKTLLVPYLLWGTIGVLVLTPLVMVCNAVGGREMWTRTVFDYGNVWGIVDHWIGITVGAPKGAFPFWYVRVLLVFFLLSPVFCLAGRLPKMLLLGVGLTWAYTLGWGLGVPYLSVRFDVFGWLLLGMAVRRCRLEECHVGTGTVWLSAALYGGVSIWAACMPVVLPCVSGVAAMGGIVFWWGLSERFACRETQAWVLKIGQKSFFIYAIHMMMTEYCLAVSGFCFKNCPAVLNLYSFVLPFVVLILAFTVASCLEKLLPRWYALLCGGR